MLLADDELALARLADDRAPHVLDVARGSAALLADPSAFVERRHPGLVRAVATSQPGRERQLATGVSTAGRPGDRVEHTVEDDCAYSVGEHRGVRRAEVGAVGDAVVGELVVTERLPDEIHVAGSVGRRHVVEEGVLVLRAEGSQIVVGLNPLAFGLALQRER